MKDAAQQGDSTVALPSSGSTFLGEARRRRGAAISIAVILRLILIAAGVALRNVPDRRSTTGDTSNITIRQLTGHQRVVGAASVSQDGKWVAYTRRDAEKRTLRVQQILSASEVSFDLAKGTFIAFTTV